MIPAPYTNDADDQREACRVLLRSELRFEKSACPGPALNDSAPSHEGDDGIRNAQDPTVVFNSSIRRPAESPNLESAGPLPSVRITIAIGN